MSFESPNQYCLDKLVRLSAQRTVSAAHDIYDDRGFKLWAKGVPVSRELQAKLAQRKLSKPIESSLTVEHALSFTEVIDDCLRHIGEEPLLQKIAGTRAVRELLAEARKLHLPPPMQLLMTSAKINDASTYGHTLLVIAICAGMAVKLKAHDNEVNNLLMAAMLHDVGETYINPEFLNPQRQLDPHEWKHIASHPVIGQVLIQEQTSLPAAVSQCVGQHHERLDGSGYPYQFGRTDQHRLAGWLAVADVTASLLAANGKAVPARIALALRIIPEEFDGDAADMLIDTLRNEKNEYCVEDGGDCLVKARNALIKIEEMSHFLKDIAESTKLPIFRQTCVNSTVLLHNLAKSMRATGVLDADMLGENIDDPELQTEMHLIVREIEWRLRNLARNLYLRAESQTSPEPPAALSRIIEMIDG